MVYTFPQLMLKAGIYPPFVHGNVYNCEEGLIPEPLAVSYCCLSAYNALLPNSRSFIHSLIETERGRLIDNFVRLTSSYSATHNQADICIPLNQPRLLGARLDCLASVHAMIIYQILGFFGPDEGQRRPAEARQLPLIKVVSSPSSLLFHIGRPNSRLLTTTDEAQMARNLAHQHLPQIDIPMVNEATWSNWPFYETIRRTLFTVNTINVLSQRLGRQEAVYWEPLNDELISGLPVPAPDALWLASSFEEWQTAQQLWSNDEAALYGQPAGRVRRGRFSKASSSSFNEGNGG